MHELFVVVVTGIAAAGCCKGMEGHEVDPSPVEAVAPVQQPVVAPVESSPATVAGKEAPAESGYQRSGEQPTMSAIRRAVEDGGVAKPKLLGKPQAVGDGRFLATVFGKESEETWLYVVSDLDGETQIEGKVELELPDVFLGYGNDPKVASRKVGDFDEDGETEAWQVVRYDTEPQPAVGGSIRQIFFVVDLGDEPAVAFHVVNKEDPEASVLDRIGGKVGFDDRDGDGHPDVVFDGHACREEETPGGDWKKVCDDFENVYPYDPSSDAWSLSPPG